MNEGLSHEWNGAMAMNGMRHGHEWNGAMAISGVIYRVLRSAYRD